jgi:hypothetical protein
LQNTESFKTAAGKLKASGNIEDAFQVVGQAVVPPIAFTLVHEVQHCKAMLDNPEIDHFIDQKVFNPKKGKNVPAIGFKETRELLDAGRKRLNPQNYAFLALFVHTSILPLRVS